jgi:hypothetical protein
MRVSNFYLQVITLLLCYNSYFILRVDSQRLCFPALCFCSSTEDTLRINLSSLQCDITSPSQLRADATKADTTKVSKITDIL